MNNWYQNKTITILLCIFLPPVGLYLIWKHKLLTESQRTIFYLIWVFPLGLYKMFKDKVFTTKTRVIITVVILTFGSWSYYSNKYLITTYTNTHQMSEGLEVKTKITFHDREFKVGKKSIFSITSSITGKPNGDYITGKFEIIKSKDGGKEIVCVPISVNNKDIDYTQVNLHSLQSETFVFKLSDDQKSVKVIVPGQHFTPNDDYMID
jgi:hypothetical protein